jgi:hypothetical protein
VCADPESDLKIRIFGHLLFENISRSGITRRGGMGRIAGVARTLFFVWMIVIFSEGIVCAQQAPINCKGPLNEEQLIGLLKGGVADVRVQAFVDKCGIDFPFTPDAERRLRDAKASDAVVTAVRTKDRQRQRAVEEERRQREELARKAAREAVRQEEEKLWAGAKDGRSAERLEEYLRRFPEGQYGSEAEDKLSKLRQAEDLCAKVRQAKKEGSWQEAEPWLMELSGLRPEDEEMHSWKSWVAGERTRWEGMTLSAAKEEVASLERKIEQVRKTTEAERDKALRQTDEKYISDRDNAAQPDMFETTAQHEQRLASLGFKYKAEREAIEKRYAEQVEAQSEGYRKQAEELRARTYVEEGAKVEFAGYKADLSRLDAKINGEQYWFRIAPETARELVPRLSTAKVQQYFGEDRAQERVLTDAATGAKFRGVTEAKWVREEQLAAKLAEQERLERRREELARITWTDPQTKLMWPLKDKGSDVDWNEATGYCRQLQLGGFSDWRLPEIGELEGIYDASSKAKGGIQLSSFWIWSATKQGSGSAWYFFFRDGKRYSFTLDSRLSNRALCVRRSGE